MKTLILDNYDSFTFNLMQAVAELNGNPVVRRNDAISMEEVKLLKPTHIIISPGPGNPYEERDIGVSEMLVEYAESERIPLLGVCLGHQVLTKYFGATVERAPKPFHGKTSRIDLSEKSRLFRGLPLHMDVMRYHSLHAREDTIPASLRITARTADGIIMAVEHTLLPLYGVQFHPESIGTPSGTQLLENFLSERNDAAASDDADELLEPLFDPATTEEDRETAFRNIIALPVSAALLVRAATFLRGRMIHVDLPGDPMDTCGTGGSGKQTLNTSTLTAFIVAACGGTVAKHGNRSASGNCGSFDLLEQLGVRIDLTPEDARRIYSELGIVFLFAPLHHPVLRTIAPLRKQHARKTLFNLLGPLVNPASVKRQMIGTANTKDAALLAEAAAALGTTNGLVVTGLDGLDEVSPCAPSVILDIASGSKSYFLPSDIGLPASHPKDIQGGSPEENARIFLELAAGKGSESQRRLVLANAAHALVVAGIAPDIHEGYATAREALLRGKVLDLFLKYRDCSSLLS